MLYVQVFNCSACGQFAVQQQVRGFEIRALFGEIFDRVAAVTQDPGVAVDIGHLADAGRGVIEGRIVAHHAEIGGIHLDLAQVHGADGVVRDGNFVGLAGAIVGDGQRFAGRGRSLRLSRLRRGVVEESISDPWRQPRPKPCYLATLHQRGTAGNGRANRPEQVPESKGIGGERRAGARR